MIKLKDVSKFYYSETNAALGLRNVNLEFKKGEFVTITGESGSGKSTLLNVISGMDTYEDGEMYYNGGETSCYGAEDWEEYRRNNVSLIYQSYNLIDSYTALENIESVLLICERNNGRMTAGERKARALECLKQVGLEKQAGNKASHLSSGQKQRLGIARALAKNTDMIMADEPTGNLDVENGKQIMQLLGELSKTKLIIVVTHNYEQAAPYTTRKVRLYDGEVVENSVLSSNDVADDAENTGANPGKKETKDKFYIARAFAGMNMKAVPHRNLFVFTFLLASAMAMVFMLGIFIKNMDDTTMRKISNIAFRNTDMTRILIKNPDGSIMKKGDFDAISKIDKTDSVDMYGSVADINYFCVQDEDYRLTYDNDGISKRIGAEMLNFGKYVKSRTVISDKDLSAGKLPESYGEIAMYTGDESLLDTDINIYFMNIKQWNNKYVCMKLKIVGILKKKTEQVYFSNELCNALSVRSRLVFANAEIIQRSVTKYENGKEDYVSDTVRKIAALPVINPELSGNDMRVSQNIFVKLKEDKVIEGESITKESINEKGTFAYTYPLTDEKHENTEMKVMSDGHASSDDVIEISADMFWKIFNEHHNNQLTAYIKDYAYTDKVISAISDKGYEAVSVFRVSSIEYSSIKIAEQLKLMGISMATMVMVFIINIFIVYALMKLKRADFIILTSLGMSRRTVKQINYHEIMTMMLAADVIAFIVMNVMAAMDVKAITSFISRYGILQYAVILAVTEVMSAITAFFFSRHLLKKFRITSLKGE